MQQKSNFASTADLTTQMGIVTYVITSDDVALMHHTPAGLKRLQNSYADTQDNNLFQEREEQIVKNLLNKMPNRTTYNGSHEVYIEKDSSYYIGFVGVR